MRTERMRKEHMIKDCLTRRIALSIINQSSAKILFNMVRADMVNLAIMLTPRQN